MMIFLSYPLSDTTPAYGGESGLFSKEAVRSLEKGESCNVSKVSLTTHIGTHIDAPFHFFINGLSITDYPASFWVFKNVKVVHIPLSKSHWLTSEDIGPSIDKNIELMLIKTDYCLKRTDRIYWEDNPGLDPDLGFYLRQSYPNLRAVGFDFISVSRWQDRDKGRSAHKAFLDPDGNGSPILLIEDMDLAPLKKEDSIESVHIVPLRIEEADGAPVTVIAETS